MTDVCYLDYKPTSFTPSNMRLSAKQNAMQLSVRDVARILSVKETTIYRWIKEAALPGYRVNNQYRFNRSELFEWATANKIEISAELFAESEEYSERFGSLSDALAAGGVFYQLPAHDKASALRAVVNCMALPEKINREFLFNILLAREALASTGVGDGIAFPHVRNPIVLQVSQALITLSFLENPVDFDAIDGKPVYCLFTIVSPTVRTHLHLLSQLSFALRDAAFNAAVRRRASREVIFEHLNRIDKEMAGFIKIPLEPDGDQ